MADDIIGSVAVEVLPSAKNFVNDFKAKVLPGARQVGNDLGNVAGTAAAKALAGRLRDGVDAGFRGSDPAGKGAKQGEQFAGAFVDTLKARIKAAEGALPKLNIDADSTPANRKVEELRLKLAALGTKRVGVDISNRDALGQIGAIRAELTSLTGKGQDVAVRFNARAAVSELDTLRSSIQGVQKAAGDSSNPSGALTVGGVIAAGLMLVGPASGAAAAGLGAVAGAGGTALLALKGIQAEVKNGTVLGNAFESQYQQAGSTLARLETVAARGAGSGFLSGLKELNAYAPELAPVVASISEHLGQAGAVTAHALISALQVAAPLLEDGGRYAEILAQKLDSAAQSPRFREFVQYARDELPTVVHDLLDVGDAGLHIALALQPIGDELLKDLDGLAKVADGLAHLAELAGRVPHLPSTIIGAANPLLGALGMLGNTNSKSSAQTKQSQQALDDLQASMAALLAPTEAGTQRINAFTVADQAARAAIDQQATSLAATTRQMYLESDAGGLLKQQLDALSGKQLDAAQAQNQFEQSLVSMVQTIKSGTPALAGLGSNAIQNRSALLNLVQSAEASAEAFGSMDKSGEKTRQKLVDLRQQIIDNAVANGENRAAVTAYIDSVLKIPTAPVVTKVDVDSAAAQTKLGVLRNTLGTLRGKTLTVDANVNGALDKIRSVVEYVNNQAPVIHVITRTSTGFIGSGRQEGEVPGKATGGLIRGPGTTTSDSILARLSDQEFVSTAESQKRNRAALEAGNRGAHLVAIPAFADGGLVSIDQSSAQIKAAASKSASAAKSAASKNQAALKAAQVLATAQANIRFTTSLDLSRLSSSGTAAAIASVIRKLVTDVHSAAAKGVGSDSLIPTLQAENNRLESLANRRASITAKIKASTASLAAQRKAFTAESNTVAGAVSGIFNITSLDGPAQFGTANPAAFIRNLQAEATQATKFAAQLGTLRSTGLNKTLIQQLGEAGVGGAGAATQSLASASKSQVAQINALYAQVQASSRVAGNQVAGSLYQAGIDSATGYINGLNSQLRSVNKAAATLANTVVKQIKKSLGIKSPSTVMRAHGRYTGEGFALGIADQYGTVARSAVGLANAAVQPSQFGRRTGGAGAPFLVQHNHMQPGVEPESFAADVSRRIYRAIK
jgi:hypothetical protein